MKIAFTSKGKTKESQVDARFGRCPYFVIMDTDSDELFIIDNQEAQNEAHGAGPKAAQLLAAQNCNVLITGNGPGGNASALLEKMNIDIYIGAADKTIEEAYKDFQNKLFKKL